MSASRQTIYTLNVLKKAAEQAAKSSHSSFAQVAEDIFLLVKDHERFNELSKDEISKFKKFASKLDKIKHNVSTQEMHEFITIVDDFVRVAMPLTLAEALTDLRKYTDKVRLENRLTNSVSSNVYKKSERIQKLVFDLKDSTDIKKNAELKNNLAEIRKDEKSYQQLADVVDTASYIMKLLKPRLVYAERKREIENLDQLTNIALFESKLSEVKLALSEARLSLIKILEEKNKQVKDSLVSWQSRLFHSEKKFTESEIEKKFDKMYPGLRVQIDAAIIYIDKFITAESSPEDVLDDIDSLKQKFDGILLNIPAMKQFADTVKSTLKATNLKLSKAIVANNDLIDNTINEHFQRFIETNNLGKYFELLTKQSPGNSDAMRAIQELKQQISHDELNTLNMLNIAEFAKKDYLDVNDKFTLLQMMLAPDEYKALINDIRNPSSEAKLQHQLGLG